VRFWASARAAAGVPEVVVAVPGEVDLDTLVGLVLDRLADRLADRDRLRTVLEVCSVLIGDRPAGAAARGSVRVASGATVEFLPPFAGG
jgi:sulfur-carrier protein